MTAETWWQLALGVVLVPLAGLFAAADAALGAVSRARVEALVRAGRSGARALAAVVADRPRYVNLLLLLRLACETTAVVLLTVVSLTLVRPDGLAMLVAAVTMVVISYVMVGVGPRTMGRQHPYRIGLWLAAPVSALARLLGPLTRLLIVVGNAITPGRGFREGPFASEVELRELVDLARQRGVVAEDESAMIHSVFELGDTRAREVMVPRTDVVWIESTKTVRQALALALRSGYSRIPVVGENVDDVVGLAYLKDLVPADQQAPVTAVMRPASFVPDSKRIDELLREMQRSHHHMAVVVDEYGGTAGLVTIEDIVEEIVGEITDEYDPDEHPPVERVEESLLRVAARLPVPDLAEATGTELDYSDVDTVAGLLAQRLGRVPLPGAEAEIAGLRLRAEGGKDARGRMRITTVLVSLPAADEPAEPGHSEDDREGSGVRG